MVYEIIFDPAAERDLDGVQKRQLSKIKNRIDRLAHDPQPPGSKKLGDGKNGLIFRVRQGEFRIVYETVSKKLVVLILMIGSRRDIYNRLSRRRGL